MERPELFCRGRAEDVRGHRKVQSTGLRFSATDGSGDEAGNEAKTKKTKSLLALFRAVEPCERPQAVTGGIPDGDSQ